jgi:protein-disulfide isomerase
MSIRARALSLAVAAWGIVLALGAPPRSPAADGQPQSGSGPRQGLTITVGAAPSLKEGSPSVVLIEVSDFQCPYCAKSALEVLPPLREKLVRTGKVELIFLNFPLPTHPNAFQAAEAALCAGDQQKFWEMHHLLFTHQQELAPARLQEYAETLGLDGAAFQKCLSTGKPAPEIRQEMRLAEQLGINATPIYLLGRRLPESGKVLVVETVRGVRPAEELEKKLNALLATK